MTRIQLENGKYTVCHNNGANFHALRHGEPWRDLTGDGLILAMAHELERLQEPVSVWVACADRMPSPEVRVLIVVNGAVRVGALFWEYPVHEDTHQAFTYWDDPEDDGQPWEHEDVTHWAPLPPLPPHESAE